MQAEINADTSLTKVGSTIIGFVTFTFIGYFTIGLALGVLPIFIHQQLGYSTVIAGIVISLQYVTTFLFRGYAGNIVDKKGPKPAVILGMAGFAISGILLFVAYMFRDTPVLSLGVLILTRLVTGFGEGLIGASPINWAIFAIGDQHTSKAISYNGIASYGALALGAPIGIILNNSYGIGSIGMLILLIGIAGFFYAKNKTAIKGNSKAPRASFMQVLKTVSPYGICLTLGGLGFGTISTFITLYYAYLNWTNAVLCLSVFSVLFILGRVFFANAIDTYGGMKISMACLAVESVGLFILWIAHMPHIALIGAGITGLGFSLVFPALGVEAVKLVPASNKGAALGGYGLFLDLSLGLTGPLVGGVASHFGMLYIFPFSMAMVFTGFILAVLIYNKQRKKLHTEI
ncbi:MFS transporter [Mucilaginibacter sp. SP1R1]|uniref:MFS transporter n=1 Tax=Mucilaginibacter sp. SP1R1 TaxID=2723091 RepID=UPI001610AFAF|nr:MFS transporter [Mucilaginibacter sp. SP1R1]MBB6149348.1 MFS family permease [Mucilaginibacter sp. SP1R1]